MPDNFPEIICESGKAISLVNGDEIGYLVDIEKLIKRQIEQIVVRGFEPDADWIYPPDKDRKRSARPTAERGERSERGPRPERGGERSERSERPPRESRDGARHEVREPREHRDRHERQPARPRHGLPMVAPDGFDFTKPYENKDAVDPTAPLAAPVDGKPHPHPTPHKAKKPVAALLGGIAPRKP